MKKNFKLTLLFVFTSTITSTALFSQKSDQLKFNSKVTNCAKICKQQDIMKAVKSDIIPTVVKSGKLSASWLAASFKKAELKNFKGQTEWMLSFRNDLEESSEKKDLYIFITKNGFLSGMNHTGKE